MPVIDHPIHDKTKIGPDHRYGCHNRPDMFVPVVQRDNGKMYPYSLSHDCRYDRSETDAHCAGCKHVGSGAAYAESVRG